MFPSRTSKISFSTGKSPGVVKRRSRQLRTPFAISCCWVGCVSGSVSRSQRRRSELGCRRRGAGQAAIPAPERPGEARGRRPCPRRRSRIPTTFIHVSNSVAVRLPTNLKRLISRAVKAATLSMASKSIGLPSPPTTSSPRLIFSSRLRAADEAAVNFDDGRAQTRKGAQPRRSLVSHPPEHSCFSVDAPAARIAWRVGSSPRR